MSAAVIEAELVAACSSLGYSDGKKYVRDPDCVETIRDLLRYLRRDDSGHSIRIALGATHVLQTDLIPLLREHSSDRTLLDLVLRLLVNLTSPALVVFHQEIPEDKTGRQTFLNLVAQQESFKEAFTDSGVWSSLASILGAGLEHGAGDRDDDTQLVVEMCLVLLRNVLAVAPGRQDNTRTHDDADLHDQVLWSLKDAELPMLLHYLSSSQTEPDLALHTIEIISLMLRQQDPQALATTALHRSSHEKSQDDAALQRVRDNERAKRQQQVKKHYSGRHSRFGGTYYVQNMKSISDRDVISHKPLTDTNSLDFDKDKKGKKIPKNRAPLQDSNTTRRSTLAIRLFLQQFCIEFLNGSYNNLMTIVKDSLNRARTQEHDESYYLWAMKFFMEFNRHYEFKVELISETLSIQTVHYVQTNIENYHEMMTTEKKKIPLWSRRMHNGLRAYQEILMTLAAMDRSPDPSVQSSSLALKSKIFYVVEYRELPLVLLQNYDSVKMSKGYLKDLIETTHVFLKLLEGMCKKTKHLMVQLPQKKKVTKKKKTKGPKEVPTAPTAEKLEEMWGEMADELSAVIQGEGGDLPQTVPFDALSEDTEDQQKEQAMRKVNALLRAKQLTEAVSLFRSSREVWPEGDIFGAQNIEVAEEFACLREVFLADLNPVQVPEPSQEEESEDEEEDEEQPERHVEESSAHISEKELDFPVFVRRFAHTKVMQAYAMLLKSYKTNTPHTNRCIVKLFHRIAWDSKLTAIFYQSSMFITFYQAMTDPSRKTDEITGEIVKFAKYIVRQFFIVAETNPKVFFEILFWKTNKDATEIECGYDVPDNSKVMKSVWSEEEEDELTRLYQEFKDKPLDPDEEKDLADVIVQNLIRQDRSRRLVIKKLKEMGLIENVRQLSKKTTRVRMQPWTETEEDELRVLHEEHKDAMDPMNRILDFMVNPKPKHRVLEKLLELGLISDKKEMRKKRVHKPKQKNARNDGERFVAANESSDDANNSEDESNESSSDDDTSSRNTSRAGISGGSSSQPRNKKKAASSTASLVVTPYLISAALDKVMNNNMSDSVQWLTELMSEVADDREADGEFDPIPILAINEEQSRAIEDEHFQSLMKILGLQPPQTHEEMFWRVPARLTIQALRKRVQYLTQGLAGTLPSVPEQGEASTPVPKTKKTARTSKKGSSKDASRMETGVDEGDSDKENNQAIRPSSANSDDVSQTARPSSPVDSDDEPLAKSSGTRGAVSSSNSVQNSPAGRSRTSKRPHSNDNVFDSLLQSPVPKAAKKRRIVVDDSDEEQTSPPANTDNLRLHLDTEDLTMDVDDTNPADSGAANTTRARIVDSSDDETDDPLPDTLGKTPSSNITSSVVSSNTLRARIVDSSDDEELGTQKSNPSSLGNTIPSDVTEHKAASRAIEDSDEDDDVPIIRSKKAIIESDEDDL